MSQRELQRVRVLTCVQEGHLPLRDAAALMGVGYRQAKRLKATFTRDGPAALVHKNRGRSAPGRTPEALRVEIERLSRETYKGFNDTHFTEMLAEREGVVVSREHC